MADTQYQIFCRYYHSTSNVSVTNQTEVKWKQAETVHTHSTDGVMAPLTTSLKSVPGVENMWIRHQDAMKSPKKDTDEQHADQMTMQRNAKALDRVLNTIIADESHNDNPKYDMMFMYKGFDTCIGPKKANTSVYNSTTNKVEDNDTSANPQIYYEIMERVDIPAPWFLYATCASLTAAMAKAEEIIRIMGTANVMIGKVVDLEEYIEII